MALETWTNESRATASIMRFDQFGKIKTELVHGGRTFTISTEDRELNQRECFTPELDPFSNGMLRPVKLSGEKALADYVSDRPNILSVEEMARLFDGKKTSAKKFDERVAGITELPVIERLLEFARNTGEATVRQLEVLEARRAALLGPVSEVQAVPPAAMGVQPDPLQGPIPYVDPMVPKPVTSR